MKKKFDWQATTKEAEAVLNGNYVDADLSEVEQLFINNLQRVTGTDATSNLLTYKEFKGKFKVWRESTTTSSSGRHLGHYKVLVSTIDQSLKPEERVKLQHIQRDISGCYIGLINYCIKHRYVLQRWKTIVNMMIYKELGNIKIHRLRVIHL